MKEKGDFSVVSLPWVRPLAHSWPTAGPQVYEGQSDYVIIHGNIPLTFYKTKNKKLFVAIYMQTLQLVLKNI